MDTTTAYVVEVDGPNDYGFFTVKTSDDKRLGTKKGELAAEAREIKANGAKAIIGYTTKVSTKGDKTYTNHYLETITQEKVEESKDGHGRKIQMTEENVRLQAMGHALKIMELRAEDPTAKNIIALANWVEAYAWHGHEGVNVPADEPQQLDMPVLKDIPADDIPF